VAAGSSPDGALDLVLCASSGYVAQRPSRSSTAVGIRAGRIVAVGLETDLMLLAGRSTRVVRVPGGTIVPGFQDAHVHPTHAGLAMLRCDLHGLTTLADYARKIRGYVRENPQVSWVLGGGWTMSSFREGTPTRQELDRLVPDRPAFLTSKDGHDAWVNTLALDAAGVTSETPDPADGKIRHTVSGDAVGTLSEGAMALVERHVLAPVAADWEEALRRSQAYLHALGITAWQDAHVDDAALTAYLALLAQGELKSRVVAALWWDRHMGLSQVGDLLERRCQGTTGRLQATSVKIMLDGIIENCTAAVNAPYYDFDGTRTTGTGIDFVDPAELREIVTTLDRHGFQAHFHAVGDRAVRSALDACEAARRANGPRDARHHVAHLEVIDPVDIPRFAELGVVANIQPLWAVNKDQMRDLRLPLLGPERGRLQYPFRSLQAAGAVLAGGSDWPVSTPNPLAEFEVATSRVLPEARQAEPFMPEERLSLASIVGAFTSGTAFVNRLDRETGAIAPGRLADLAVLSTDIFAPDAGPVGDAKVVLTLVEGEVVFADSSAVSW
jgi:predicted amidohydrolase YtcJ